MSGRVSTFWNINDIRHKCSLQAARMPGTGLGDADPLPALTGLFLRQRNKSLSQPLKAELSVENRSSPTPGTTGKSPASRGGFPPTAHHSRLPWKPDTLPQGPRGQSLIQSRRLPGEPLTLVTWHYFISPEGEGNPSSSNSGQYWPAEAWQFRAGVTQQPPSNPLTG